MQGGNYITLSLSLLSASIVLLHPCIHSCIHSFTCIQLCQSPIQTLLNSSQLFSHTRQTSGQWTKHTNIIPASTAQFFILSGKSYLIHEFHSSKCLNTGRSGCQRAISDMRGCTVVCFKLSPHQDHVILTNSVRCLITARSSNAYEES